VEQGRHLFPNLDSARKLRHINEVQGYAPSGLSKHFTGKGVLFGILDTEFDSIIPSFWIRWATRGFVSLWDQTDTSNIAGTGSGTG